MILYAEGGSASMFVLKTAVVSLDGERICTFAALAKVSCRAVLMLMLSAPHVLFLFFPL